MARCDVEKERGELSRGAGRTLLREESRKIDVNDGSESREGKSEVQGCWVVNREEDVLNVRPEEVCDCLSHAR